MLKMLIALAAMLLATPASADVVADWSELLTSVDKAASPPDYMFDADTAQSGSKTMLAIFEAANAVDPRYRSYVGLAAAAQGASIDAAVATAAHDALIIFYPSQKQTIKDAYLLAMARIPEGPGREAGIATGKAAAVAAMAAGGVDAALPLAPYHPTALAGKWAPSSIPFDPRELQIRPWFMKAAADLRIAPPPALSSATYAASFNETRTRGAKDSKVRSAADTLASRFWAFYELSAPMRQIADQPGRTTVQNAHMYALIAMAGDDTGLMMVDGKLHYAFWRPMNAIRQADIDGNDATTADPLWEPLLRTPGQPEYPCGHCTYAAVISTILAAEGAPPPGGLHFTNDQMPGISMTVPDWPTYAKTVDQSRIDGGVHYRFTADASDVAGAKLGRMALARLSALN